MRNLGGVGQKLQSLGSFRGAEKKVAHLVVNVLVQHGQGDAVNLCVCQLATVRVGLAQEVPGNEENVAKARIQLVARLEAHGAQLAKLVESKLLLHYLETLLDRVQLVLQGLAHDGPVGDGASGNACRARVRTTVLVHPLVKLFRRRRHVIRPRRIEPYLDKSQANIRLCVCDGAFRIHTLCFCKTAIFCHSTKRETEIYWFWIKVQLEPWIRYIIFIFISMRPCFS